MKNLSAVMHLVDSLSQINSQLSDITDSLEENAAVVRETLMHLVAEGSEAPLEEDKTGPEQPDLASKFNLLMQQQPPILPTGLGHGVHVIDLSQSADPAADLAKYFLGIDAQKFPGQE